MDITISPVFQQFQRQNHQMISENMINNTPAPKKNGSKKLARTLMALGVIAAAGVAVATSIKKGKIFKLDNVTFNKGIATLKEGGEKFTGTIIDKLKNGDDVLLKYKDGILEESQRAGSKTFKKVFENINGAKIVHKFQDDKEIITNISEKIANALPYTYKTRSEKIAQTVQDTLITKNFANKSAEESAKVFEEFFENQTTTDKLKRGVKSVFNFLASKTKK